MAAGADDVQANSRTAQQTALSVRTDVRLRRLQTNCELNAAEHLESALLSPNQSPSEPTTYRRHRLSLDSGLRLHWAVGVLTCL